MNYLDYKRIMTQERLPQTTIVKLYLDEAVRKQNLIRRLKQATDGNVDKQVNRLLKEKDCWIEAAIEMARWSKNNPGMNNWFEEAYKNEMIRENDK